MKLSTKTKILAVSLTAICISFSSCVDENIDLNNLSNNMKYSGTLATPIGEMTVTMKEIVDSLEFDSTTNVSLNVVDDVITLHFSDTLEYAAPPEIDYSNFGSFTKILSPSTDPEIPVFTPPPGDVTYTVTESYNFNDINIDPAKQRIDSIRFTNTVIKATVSTNLPTGFVSIHVHLPVEFEGETSQVVKMDLNNGTNYGRFPAENFVVRAEGKSSSTFPIDVIVHGDGVTPIPLGASININVYLDSVNYTAYGYFNNGSDLLPENESIKLDLNSILPEGSQIFPHNPEFQFDVTSNIGIPLLFNIKGLKTFSLNTTPKDSVAASFSGSPSKSFVIHRASTVGSSTTTSIILNKEIANGKTADLFKIKVDSASTRFSFGVKDTTYSTPEFASSNSKIKVKLSVNMPFWLDEKSIITSTDTIFGIDDELDQLLKNEYAEVKEAALRIKYTNMLPMTVTAYLRLLGQDTLTVPGSSLYTYEIKSAPVDASGATVAPGTQQTFDIKFDASNIEYLKKTKHIKLTVEAKGFDFNSSKIKFRITDWIKIKLSAYVIGEGKN